MARLPETERRASFLAKLSPQARERVERNAPEVLAELAAPGLCFAEDISRKLGKLDTAPRNRRERRIEAAMHAPPTPPPAAQALSDGRPLTKAQRKRRRRRAREVTTDEGRYMDKLIREGAQLAKWKDRAIERLKKFALEGEGVLTPRAGWKREAWISFRSNRWDGSGHALKSHLALLRTQGFGPFVGAVCDAALGSVDELGARARDWTSDRARSIAAEAIALLLQGKRATRKGPFQHCVTGLTIESICALHENPFNGHRPHPNTIRGRHRRDGTVNNGGLGYHPALRATGAMNYAQLPVDEVEPYERWKVERVNRITGEVEVTEQASNRYWLLSSEVANAHATELTRERLRELETHCAVLTQRRVAVRPRRYERLSVPFDLDPAPAPS